MTIQEITTRIEQVKNYIHDCERRISQGEAVELSGLDENVENICLEIEKLPKDDAKSLESKLMNLVSALDKLVNVIHEFEGGDADEGEPASNENEESTS